MSESSEQATRAAKPRREARMLSKPLSWWKAELRLWRDMFNPRVQWDTERLTEWLYRIEAQHGWVWYEKMPKAPRGEAAKKRSTEGASSHFMTTVLTSEDSWEYRGFGTLVEAQAYVDDKAEGSDIEEYRDGRLVARYTQYATQWVSSRLPRTQHHRTGRSGFMNGVPRADADAIASDWAAVGRDLKAAIDAYQPTPLERIKAFPKGRRVWFYAPDLYWFGWKTLLPVTVGHDEWSRRTLVIGWSITGQVVIPIGYCGDDECYRETLEYIRWLQENEGDVLARWSEWVAGVEVNGRKFTANDPAYALATAAFYAGWGASTGINNEAALTDAEQVIAEARSYFGANETAYVVKVLDGYLSRTQEGKKA